MTDGNPIVDALIIAGQAFWMMFPALVTGPFAVLFGGGAPIDMGKKDSKGRRILGDGKTWGQPALIGENRYWLWRVTWHRGEAYGVGRIANERIPRFYKAKNGRNFEVVVKDRDFVPHVPGPSEATVRFLADNTALCLLRLNRVPGAKTVHGHLGVARPPYTDWRWHDLGAQIGGPNMIQIPDGQFVAVVRLYAPSVRTSLCWLDPDKGTMAEALRLPSGGDTSYAGLVWHDELLWISYYSSHEGKTSIYLAKVKIPRQ